MMPDTSPRGEGVPNEDPAGWKKAMCVRKVRKYFGEVPCLFGSETRLDNASLSSQKVLRVLRRQFPAKQNETQLNGAVRKVELRHFELRLTFPDINLAP